MSAHQDSAELLPCLNALCDLSRPFLNETDGDLAATHTWVSCENCGARGPRIENPLQYYGKTFEWDEVKARAITAWNTRTDTTLREQRDELLEALEDVRSRIAASDEWWMECHDRGGFDTDQIDAAIAKARS